MATRVVYQGSAVQNIGRFGKVSPGQILTLEESERESVKGNPDFRIIEGAKQSTQKVKLEDTTHYRLTLLPWGTAQIHRAVHRKGKTQLFNISRAFVSLGADCPVSADMGRRQLADVILEAGRRIGWVI